MYDIYIANIVRLQKEMRDRKEQHDKAVKGFEEFMQEAPKTLRTNLIKLAKTNGNDLGFLS